MKKVTTLSVVALIITSCANKPLLTLDEKLANAKDSKERKEVLRLACLNEAEWPIYSSHRYKIGDTKQRAYDKNSYNAEVSEMKSLCRKMNEYEDFDKSNLLTQCQKKIADKLEKYGDKALEHTKRTLTICQQMTIQSTHK